MRPRVPGRIKLGRAYKLAQSKAPGVVTGGPMTGERRRASKSGETYLRLVLPSGQFCDVVLAGAAATVSDVKEALLANWPATWAAEVDRRSVTGVRLMHGGRFLHDRTPICNLGLPRDQYVTMHAVVRTRAAPPAMHGSGEFCAQGVHEAGRCNHGAWAGALASNGNAAHALPGSLSSLGAETRGWERNTSGSFSYMAVPRGGGAKAGRCRTWCCVM